MRWLAPQVLWILPTLILLPLLWRSFEKNAQKKLGRFASSNVLPVILKNVDMKRRRTRFVLGFLALVFALVALARPQMGAREEVLSSEGLDMAILVDVSNSMLAEDVVPSRLKKAKHLIKNFVDRLSGDRVGLVAFAGSAYPAVPLTTDYEFLRQTLEVIDESAIANQGSNLARALEVGTQLLVRGGANEENEPNVEQSDDSASRVIIVISDGEATEGEESTLVARLKQLGIKVFTLGVGSTKGAPIPLRDQAGYLRGYKKDPSGTMVHTKLETRNLESIAEKTGGSYYNASANEGEVEEIISRLSSFERKEGAGRRVVVYEELYQYPLALAVFFFMFMLLLKEAKARRAGTIKNIAAVLALFVFSSHAKATTSITEYDETRKGLEAYEQKDYAGAVQSFGKAQAASPESPTHRMNLGDAFLMSGSPDAAIPEFEQVTKSKDGNEAARGAYNMGKAFEAQKNFEKALQSYQLGLNRLNDVGEKADPEVELRIKRALEQAEQQKQQQKQQQGKGDGNQPKDQQDQNDDGKKDKEQQSQVKSPPKQKPKFQQEKLSESDAKRIMQQLQEQEKKTQQRVMRNKSGKPERDKNDKDW